MAGTGPTAHAQRLMTLSLAIGVLVLPLTGLAVRCLLVLQGASVVGWGQGAMMVLIPTVLFVAPVYLLVGWLTARRLPADARDPRYRSRRYQGLGALVGLPFGVVLLLMCLGLLKGLREEQDTS